MNDIFGELEAGLNNDGEAFMWLVIGCMIGMVLLVLSYWWIVVPSTIGIFLIMKRRFIMETVGKIKDILGATDKTTKMKLDAIAKHLKVKLVHVPEHYTCKSILTAKAPEVAKNEGTNSKL
jgi:hypothetical protein